jgi:hypothetical protein
MARVCAVARAHSNSACVASPPRLPPPPAFRAAITASQGLAHGARHVIHSTHFELLILELNDIL